MHEFSVAGSWLFSGRRWLDPSDPEDRTMLDLHYDNLCTLVPQFCRCSRERFLSAISAVIASWSRRCSDAAENSASAPPSPRSIEEGSRSRSHSRVVDDYHSAEDCGAGDLPALGKERRLAANHVYAGHHLGASHPGPPTFVAPAGTEQVTGLEYPHGRSALALGGSDPNNLACSSVPRDMLATEVPLPGEAAPPRVRRKTSAMA